MQYRPDLDALRAVAVAMVFGFHAGLPGFGAGFIGVDVFFVLSGYLIGQIWLADEPRNFQAVVFLARRFRRIAPLMVVVIGAVLIASTVVLLPDPLRDTGQAAIAGLLFLPNWLFWIESGYFTAAAAEKPLLHLWSLGVEAQFYVFFALTAAIFRRKLLILGVISIVAVCSFLLSAWASTHMPDAAYFLTPIRLWELLAGVLLAGSGRAGQLGASARYVGGACLILGLVLIKADTPFPGFAALWPVGAAVFLILARPVQVPAVLSGLGRRSYGLYLWHLPVLLFLGPELAGLPVILYAGVCLIVSLMLTEITYRGVETPWRKGEVRARWVSMTAAVAPIVVLGGTAHLTGGLPQRLNEPAQAFLKMTRLPQPSPCHDALTASDLLEGARCRIGDPERVPDLVLIGDSHAGHLSAVLDGVLKSEGRAAYVATRGWCAPLPGFGTGAPNRGADCADFAEAAWEMVEADPEISDVIMAGSWGLYLTGMRSDLPEVTYGFNNRAYPRAGDALFAAWSALAVRLEGSDRSVVLVGSTPEFTMHVPKAVLTDMARDGVASPQADAYDFAIRRLHRPDALGDDVKFVDPLPLFCDPDGICDVLSPDGAPLFRDSNHLTQVGAARVVAEIMKVLNDPGEEEETTPWIIPPLDSAKPIPVLPNISPARFYSSG